MHRPPLRHQPRHPIAPPSDPHRNHHRPPHRHLNLPPLPPPPQLSFTSSSSLSSSFTSSSSSSSTPSHHRRHSYSCAVLINPIMSLSPSRSPASWQHSQPIMFTNLRLQDGRSQHSQHPHPLLHCMFITTAAVINDSYNCIFILVMMPQSNSDQDAKSH